MAELDPALLARVQFAFTVSFHIILPTMSIGLVWFLVMVEGLWLKTGDLLYQQIYRFWLNIFAMSFAVGVVTGIVLSFEFGLAFANFSQLAGPVIGPLIGLEVLTSFFLVAGVSAWYLLRSRETEFARRTLSLGMGSACVLIATQIFVGDLLYGTMLKHQPAKMQAAEGFWERQSVSPAPYLWIIVPDQSQQRNLVQLGTPYLGSIWLTHSLDGRVE